MHMACENPGLLRRATTQAIELIAQELRDEPPSEHLTKALFYLAGYLDEMTQYWDQRGVISCSRQSKINNIP
jgi:hypothetical protein